MAHHAPTYAKVHFGGDLLWVSDADAAAAGLETYVPSTPAVLVKDPSVWLVKALDTQWLVAYRLVAQGGSLVVAELRVYPNEGQLEAGRWSGRLAGLKATVPPGGLTARTHHKAKVGADVGQALPKYLAQLARERPDLYAYVQGLGVPSTAARRSRRGRSNRQIAEVAATYVRALERRSPHPIQDAARTHRLSPATVSQIIYTARHQLHFLTPAVRGEARGRLTTEGQRALKKERRVQ